MWGEHDGVGRCKAGIKYEFSRVVVLNWQGDHDLITLSLPELTTSAKGSRDFYAKLPYFTGL